MVSSLIGGILNIRDGELEWPNKSSGIKLSNYLHVKLPWAVRPDREVWPGKEEENSVETLQEN